MAAETRGNLVAELARLNGEAERAGQALACLHQSAEELHRDMIRRYFASRPRRRPGHPFAVASLTALFVLL